MKFPKLIIQNFLAITKAEMSLADRGLTLIQGVNNDDTSATSNGAGKSSIADALCWCLYGITARDVSGDDVINEQAGKETFVTVMIEDGADHYRVTRHRKHKTGKNALHVFKLDPTITGALNEINLTKGTDKLTQEVVDKILGSSFDVFRSSICAGQEQMPDLPSMTDKNLKSLLEEASGATVLEAAYEEARQRVIKAKGIVADIEAKIASLTRSVSTSEDTIATIARNKDDWDTSHKARLAAAKQELKRWIDDINALKTEASSETADALQKEIDDYTDKISASAGERTALLNMQRELATHTAQLNALGDKLVILTRQETAIKSELSKINHKIGCPCDSCGRPLTADELKSATEAVQKRLDICCQAIKDETLEQIRADAKRVHLEQDIEKFEKSMTDVSDIANLQAETQRNLSELKSKQAVLKTKTDHAKAHAETVKQISNEVNPHLATIAQLEGKLNALKADVAKAETELLSAQYDLDVDHVVASVYSPAGARAVILDEITPELNSQTAKYLSTLSDGNISATWTTLVRNSKGELREKFSIEVTNDKGAKTFRGLSGGEKRKVRLATALALQDLVATRAIKPIDLFIGDEIDDALDPAGLERLTQILEEKAKDRGSVMIISHNDLTDWISNIIQIEKASGGGTTIREIAA